MILKLENIAMKKNRKKKGLFLLFVY